VFEEWADVELLEAMGDAQQAERAAFARQLMAVGRFTQRRIEQGTDEHNFWCVDDWEVIAAEVGAELGISRGRASSQMRYGTALLERFPKLGEVFLAGQVDFRVIAAAVFRTDLIKDDAALAEIDAQLTRKAPSWNKLSREKIAALIDWMVIDLDPDAVRVAKQRDLDRHIEVEPRQDGMAQIWGEVRAPDAAALDTKLNELAATVCPDDPRTKTQRRADALTPLAAGATSMPCTCGSPDCPAATTDTPAAPVVINVIAEGATVDGSSDKPGYLPGYGAIPAATVQEMAKHASLRPVPAPTDLLAEPQYRSSAGPGPIRPLPRLDMPLAGLRPTRLDIRHRPHRAVSVRAHPSVEQQALLSNPAAKQPPSRQAFGSSRFGYPTNAGSQTEHDQLFESPPGGLEMVVHENESDQIAVG